MASQTSDVSHSDGMGVFHSIQKAIDLRWANLFMKYSIQKNVLVVKVTKMNAEAKYSQCSSAWRATFD